MLLILVFIFVAEVIFIVNFRLICISSIFGEYFFCHTMRNGVRSIIIIFSSHSCEDFSFR